jgi:uncharacterized protein YoxC
VNKCNDSLTSFCQQTEYDCIKTVAEYCSESTSKASLEHYLETLYELESTLEYLPGDIIRVLRTEFQSVMDKTDEDISGLSTRVNKADGDISGLGTRVNKAYGDISELDTRVNKADGDISGLGTRVNKAYGDISELDTRVNKADGSISAHDAALAQIYATDEIVDVQTGTVEVSPTHFDNIRINFERSFKTQPRVTLVFSSLNMNKSENIRLELNSRDVSLTGFVMKAFWSTHFGTSIDSASVTWIASATPEVQVGSFRFDASHPDNPLKLSRGKLCQKITFPEKMSSIPHIFYGLDFFDIERNNGADAVRLRVSLTEVTDSYFELCADSWWNSITWRVGVGWMASVSPKVQAGKIANMISTEFSTTQQRILPGLASTGVRPMSVTAKSGIASLDLDFGAHFSTSAQALLSASDNFLLSVTGKRTSGERPYYWSEVSWFVIAGNKLQCTS